MWHDTNDMIFSKDVQPLTWFRRLKENHLAHNRALGCQDSPEPPKAKAYIRNKMN